MENKILDLFLYNNKLKFSELAYHLKELVKKNILIKKEDCYLLSETAEYLIPYLSDKKAVLPVILIHIGDKNKAFLYRREKRPFKNYLSLPGGRLLIKESIKQATKRIMKDKFNISVEFKKIKSISLEHVKKSDKILHSFLLIFVLAKTSEKIKLTDTNKNKLKIILSDYKLIKNKEADLRKIKTIYSKTHP